MKQFTTIQVNSPLGVRLQTPGGVAANVVAYTADPNVELAAQITSGDITDGTLALGPAGLYQLMAGTFTFLNPAAAPPSYTRVLFAPNGAVNSGPVYNDWATLVAAVNAIGAPAFIQIDTASVIYTLPVGIYTFTVPVEINGMGRLNTAIHFNPATTITNVTKVSNMTVEGIGVNNLDGLFHSGLNTFYMENVHLRGTLTVLKVPTGSNALALLRLVSCKTEPTGTLYFSSAIVGYCYVEGRSEIAPDSFLSLGMTFITSPQSTLGHQSSASPIYTFSDPSCRAPTLVMAPTTLPHRGVFRTTWSLLGTLTLTLPNPAYGFGPLYFRHDGPLGSGDVHLVRIGQPDIIVNPQQAVSVRSDGTTWAAW